MKNYWIQIGVDNKQHWYIINTFSSYFGISKNILFKYIKLIQKEILLRWLLSINREYSLGDLAI